MDKTYAASKHKILPKTRRKKISTTRASWLVRQNAFRHRNDDSIFDSEDSLKDDYWMDEFDLIAKDKTPLRQKNLLHKNVRADYNRNSSIDCTPSPLQSVITTRISRIDSPLVTSILSPRPRNSINCTHNHSIGNAVAGEQNGEEEFSTSTITKATNPRSTLLRSVISRNVFKHVPNSLSLPGSSELESSCEPRKIAIDAAARRALLEERHKSHSDSANRSTEVSYDNFMDGMAPVDADGGQNGVVFRRGFPCVVDGDSCAIPLHGTPLTSHVDKENHSEGEERQRRRTARVLEYSPLNNSDCSVEEICASIISGTRKFIDTHVPSALNQLDSIDEVNERISSKSSNGSIDDSNPSTIPLHGTPLTSHVDKENHSEGEERQRRRTARVLEYSPLNNSDCPVEEICASIISGTRKFIDMHVPSASNQLDSIDEVNERLSSKSSYGSIDDSNPSTDYWTGVDSHGEFIGNLNSVDIVPILNGDKTMDPLITRVPDANNSIENRTSILTDNQVSQITGRKLRNRRVRGKKHVTVRSNSSSTSSKSQSDSVDIALEFGQTTTEGSNGIILTGSHLVNSNVISENTEEINSKIGIGAAKETSASGKNKSKKNSECSNQAAALVDQTIVPGPSLTEESIQSSNADNNCFSSENSTSKILPKRSQKHRSSDRLAALAEKKKKPKQYNRTYADIRKSVLLNISGMLESPLLTRRKRYSLRSKRTNRNADNNSERSSHVRSTKSASKTNAEESPKKDSQTLNLADSRESSCISRAVTDGFVAHEQSSATHPDNRSSDVFESENIAAEVPCHSEQLVNKSTKNINTKSSSAVPFRKVKIKLKRLKPKGPGRVRILKTPTNIGRSTSKNVPVINEVKPHSLSRNKLHCGVGAATIDQNVLLNSKSHNNIAEAHSADDLSLRKVKVRLKRLQPNEIERTTSTHFEQHQIHSQMAAVALSRLPSTSQHLTHESESTSVDLGQDSSTAEPRKYNLRSKRNPARFYAVNRKWQRNSKPTNIEPESNITTPDLRQASQPKSREISKQPGKVNIRLKKNSAPYFAPKPKINHMATNIANSCNNEQQPIETQDATTTATNQRASNDNHKSITGKNSEHSPNSIEITESRKSQRVRNSNRLATLAERSRISKKLNRTYAEIRRSILNISAETESPLMSRRKRYSLRSKRIRQNALSNQRSTTHCQSSRKRSQTTEDSLEHSQPEEPKTCHQRSVTQDVSQVQTHTGSERSAIIQNVSVDGPIMIDKSSRMQIATEDEAARRSDQSSLTQDVIEVAGSSMSQQSEIIHQTNEVEESAINEPSFVMQDCNKVYSINEQSSKVQSASEVEEVTMHDYSSVMQDVNEAQVEEIVSQIVESHSPEPIIDDVSAQDMDDCSNNLPNNNESLREASPLRITSLSRAGSDESIDSIFDLCLENGLGESLNLESNTIETSHSGLERKRTQSLSLPRTTGSKISRHTYDIHATSNIECLDQQLQTPSATENVTENNSSDKICADTFDSIVGITNVLQPINQTDDEGLAIPDNRDSTLKSIRPSSSCLLSAPSSARPSQISGVTVNSVDTPNQTTAMPSILDVSIDRDTFVNTINQNATKFNNKSFLRLDQSIAINSSVRLRIEGSIPERNSSETRERPSSCLHAQENVSIVRDVGEETLIPSVENSINTTTNSLASQSIILTAGKWRRTLRKIKRTLLSNTTELNTTHNNNSPSTSVNLTLKSKSNTSVQDSPIPSSYMQIPSNRSIRANNSNTVNGLNTSRRLNSTLQSRNKVSGLVPTVPELLIEDSIAEEAFGEQHQPNVLLLEPTDDGTSNLRSISLLESAVEQNLHISSRSSQKSAEQQQATSESTTIVAVDSINFTKPIFNVFEEPNECRRQIYQHQLSVPVLRQPSLPRRRSSHIERRSEHSIIPIPTSGGRQKQQQQLRIYSGSGEQIDVVANFNCTDFDFVYTRSPQLSARDRVLRRCNQSEPLDFAEVYSENVLRHCRKIGEGVYGEVFMNKTASGEAVVLKIIPIEGTVEVNGEQQKKFSEILSEIVIAIELSALRQGKKFKTGGFVEVKKVSCVQGRYPDHLIDLWELYRDNYNTENDHPEIFPDDQLYMVFELANGGQDLEAFTFQNALQSYSAFIQTALTLAIAEKKFQFEHRDLHWGNILLAPTDDEEIVFHLNDEEIKVASHGVKVTIIDYTLSRMVYEDICFYNDLSTDAELFLATGDYQFDIYRLMKQHVKNNWEAYEPFSNVLWLHYTIDKMISGARYRCTKSKKHRSAIHDMMQLRDDLLSYKSASNYVESFSK